MLVTMLQTRRGTEDGFALRQYHKGHTYDMRDNLACAFISNGYGEPFLGSTIDATIDEEFGDNDMPDLSGYSHGRAGVND